jgi:hypothetical protein
MASDLGFSSWGGQDLNLRPTDYEFDPAISVTCGIDYQGARDQRFLFRTSRMTSRRFPVRRGADAGQIVANSHVRRVVAISLQRRIRGESTFSAWDASA